PVPKAPAAGQEDLPPYDGKLHRRQDPGRNGGKVALYARNRHGNYPLARYAFHLGLRNDALAVANPVNPLYGNRQRAKPLTQKPLDVVPGARGGSHGGPGGQGGHGGDQGAGEAGGSGGTGVAGAAGMNGENATGSDEFQVTCHAGSEHRIVDLGKVDYATVD